MKATHKDLVHLGNLLDYVFPLSKLCQGYDGMWMLAALAEDEESFYQRLDLIAQYKGNFAALVARIKSIQNMVTTKQPLALEQRSYLEVLSFFDGMKLFFSPHTHTALFNKYTRQHDLKRIYKMVKPQVLEKTKLTSWTAIHAFDAKRLTGYLADIAYLSKTYGSFPIMLIGDIHAVGLRFNPHQNVWHYLDINDAYRYPQLKRYYRALSSTEVVESLFQSFLETGHHVFFHATWAAINLNSNQKAAFNQMRQHYALQPTDRTLLNCRRVSLLFLACQTGRLDDVLYLIDGHAELVNQPETTLQVTPFYIACQNGHANVVQALLAYQPKLDQAIDNGGTPLFIACDHGHLAIVKLLLNHSGMSLSIINQPHKKIGETPIFVACQHGHALIVRELIKHGADVKQARYDRVTPFFIACQQGQTAVIKTLLTTYPFFDVNQERDDGFTGLAVACKNGHFEVVIELLNAKAAINQPDKNGYTPFVYACVSGSTRLLHYLLDQGADVYYKTNTGATTLMIASQFNQLEIVKRLLAFQVDVNAQTKEGTTALYVACQDGYFDIVQQLLLYHADTESSLLLNGNTPLFIACENGHSPIVIELLKHQANPHHKNGKDFTPLAIACYKGHIDIVQSLLKDNSIEHDLLKLTCSSPHTTDNEALFSFLSQRIDFLIKDNNGKTVLDNVFENGHDMAKTIILAKALEQCRNWQAMMSLDTKRQIEAWLCQMQNKNNHTLRKLFLQLTQEHLDQQQLSVANNRQALFSIIERRKMDSETNQPTQSFNSKDH